MFELAKLRHNSLRSRNFSLQKNTNTLYHRVLFEKSMAMPDDHAVKYAGYAA